MSAETIAALSGRLDRREISPVELARNRLDRIERLDPGLNAFLTITPDRALADARAAEARMMKGERRGPLDGIPIAHKDIVNTAGIPTTANSRLLLDHVPATDATVARRLAEAGTVMLGKLATHEFALGGPSEDMPWAPPRNPWNTKRYAGGSSSGTAVAIAAGMICGGTGTDTGGSIRVPAALCGIAGIKPTFGRVSRAGVQPLSYSMDHVGPMAATVQDCAILLNTFAGHDAADPASLNAPVPDFAAGLELGLLGLRVGVITNFHETDAKVSAPVDDAFRHAVAVMAELGATVTDVTLPPLQDFSAAGWIIQLVEAHALHQPWLRTRYHEYGLPVREKLAAAGLLSGADYVQAQRRRRELCDEVGAAMEGLDLLVTIGQPTEAAPFAEVPRWPFLVAPSFTIPFDVTGQPVIAIPSGIGPNGLPLSMQIAGRALDEATVLRAAHAVECALFPHGPPRPVMAHRR